MRVKPLDSRIVNTYNQYEYLCYLIAYHVSPTMQGIKPSNLITFRNSYQATKDKTDRKFYKKNIWDIYKKRACEKLGLSYVELHKRKDMVVVLFYNKEELEAIINKEETRSLLREYDYPLEFDLDSIFESLKKRFSKGCPNEIGIFLGYPREDVYDFIYNKNKSCLLTGYWKVYQNKEAAISTFSKYDNIRCKVVDILSRGARPDCIKTYLKSLEAV